MLTISNGASLVDVRTNAEKYPRFCQYLPEQRVSNMGKVILYAYTLYGQSVDNNKLMLMSQMLCDEVMNDADGYGLRYMTFEEMMYAVRKSLLSLDKEVYGVNIRSLYKVFATYARGEGKQAQEEANRRYKERQRKALESSSVGAVIDIAARAMLVKSK